MTEFLYAMHSKNDILTSTNLQSFFRLDNRSFAHAWVVDKIVLEPVANAQAPR